MRYRQNGDFLKDELGSTQCRRDRRKPVKITAVRQGARGPTILHTFVYCSTAVQFVNCTFTTSHQASHFATDSHSYRLSTKIV